MNLSNLLFIAFTYNLAITNWSIRIVPHLSKRFKKITYHQSVVFSTGPMHYKIAAYIKTASAITLLTYLDSCPELCCLWCRMYSESLVGAWTGNVSLKSCWTICCVATASDVTTVMCHHCYYWQWTLYRSVINTKRVYIDIIYTIVAELFKHCIWHGEISAPYMN